MKTLDDLFKNQRKRLYDAEKKLVGVLGKVIDKTSDKELRDLFSNILKENKKLKKRLEPIGEELGINVSIKTSKAVKGIIQEIEDFLEKDLDNSMRDAGFITQVQEAGHLKIAAYRSACTYAEELIDEDLSKRIKMSLDKER